MLTIDKEKEVQVKSKITFAKEENIGNIGTLKVTKELQQLIDKLHCTIGAVEWSGILFYKLTKGNLKDLKNLEFTASFLYPMNIGSHTYTEFEYNGEIMDAYDLYEAGIESNTGLIHSHSSFSTFFSGTDQTELKDNASCYNFYVSLIVNFDHKYCAKIAFPSKTKVVSEFSIKDTFGKLFNKKSVKEENTILIGDLNVIIENDTINLPWLENRIVALETKKKQAFVPVQSQIPFSNYSQREFYDGIEDSYTNKGIYSTKYFNRNTDTASLNTRSEKIETKSQEFLASLIWLDASKSNLDIKEGLKSLEKLAEDELDIFEQSLDGNIQIIHQNVYNTDSEISLKRHCLEALLELSDYEIGYGKSEAYEILYTTLGLYI